MATSKPKKEKAFKPTTLTEPVAEEIKNEVKEPVIETPIEEIIEPEVQEEIKFEDLDGALNSKGEKMTGEDVKYLFLETGVLLGKSKEELSMEDKILKFLDSRPSGEIKLNDFLKSLFPPPTYSAPASWLSQPVSKQLRVMLEKMHNSGQISLVGTNYNNLGRLFYPDSSTLKSEYHSLADTVITVVK